MNIPNACKKCSFIICFGLACAHSDESVGEELSIRPMDDHHKEYSAEYASDVFQIAISGTAANFSNVVGTLDGSVFTYIVGQPKFQKPWGCQG